MEKNPETARVLQSVKNSMQGSTLCLEMKDVGHQAKSYVMEMSQFIDVAQKQNRKILEGKSLI